MKRSRSIIILSAVIILLSSWIPGCIDEKEGEKIDSFQVLSEYISDIDNENFLEACSLQIDINGTYLQESNLSLFNEMKEKLVSRYATYGKMDQTLNFTITRNLEEGQKLKDEDWLIESFIVKTTVFTGYQKFEQVTNVDFISFNNGKKTGILYDDIQSIYDNLFVFPLWPEEGDLNFNINSSELLYVNTTTQIPINLTITNISPYNLLVREFFLTDSFQWNVVDENGEIYSPLLPQLDHNVIHLLLKPNETISKNLNIFRKYSDLASDESEYLNVFNTPGNYSVSFNYRMYAKYPDTYFPFEIESNIVEIEIIGE
jgi:hypothetical protein